MASLGPGRKRTPNRNGGTPEEDTLNAIAREAEARLTAKRAARAEARDIRMKELERQQKEIYQVQKKYYGLENMDNKCWQIEQWMEDSEQYTHQSQQLVSLSSSRTSSTTSSRCTSPVAFSSTGVRDVYHGSIPDVPNDSSRVSTDTFTLLSGASSNKGSESSSADTETSLRDIKEIHELKDQIHDVEIKYMQSLKERKDCLSEMEIKYRKAMVSNAQLDNEKSNLIYEVDSLKDSLMELEELLSETRRDCEEKNNDLEREKHAHSILQFQFRKQKETLKQSEELLNDIRQLNIKHEGFIREISDLQETVNWKDKKIKALEKQREFSDAIRNERDDLRDEVVQLKDTLKKHGIAIGSELCTNGDVGVNVSGATPCFNLKHGSSILEIRLRKLLDERENLIEQVKNLNEQLGQMKNIQRTDEGCSSKEEITENSTNRDIMEIQRYTNRQVSDLKFKLVKSEQDITALEQNVTRLEGQVSRYKSAAENAEKVEDELKAEKRKLQRELHCAIDKIEELKANNSHLNKRLEKLNAFHSTTATP